MANPLFNLLNNSAQVPVNTPMGNAMAMLKQFQQFKNNFHGDPKAEVIKMLNNGQMTQAQFNQPVSANGSTVPEPYKISQNNSRGFEK